MNDRIQNQLNAVGACINVAQSTDYKPVWTGKEPADFATDLAKLQADYGAVTAKAAQAVDALPGAGGRDFGRPSSVRTEAIGEARCRVETGSETTCCSRPGSFPKWKWLGTPAYAHLPNRK